MAASVCEWLVHFRSGRRTPEFVLEVRFLARRAFSDIRDLGLVDEAPAAKWCPHAYRASARTLAQV